MDRLKAGALDAAAIAEARTRAGKNEKIISKSENFLKDIGQQGHWECLPWCASFVNFSLKSAEKTYGASPSSQFVTVLRKFVKLENLVWRYDRNS